MTARSSRTSIALAACVTLQLGACASIGGTGGSGAITIASDPAGASVLANGAEIGTTPLTITPSTVFSTGVTSGSDSLLAYRYIGRLTVRKAGCKDYLAEVDDRLLSGDITVTLECDPAYHPPPVAEPRQELPASAGERLLRIEALHGQGLISDTEYRELRQRVLDTL